MRNGDGGETQGRRSGPTAADQTRRALLCLLVLATGTWFLARGIARAEAQMPWLAAWPLRDDAFRWLPLAAALIGASLIFACVALADGRPWGWLLGAALSLVTFGLAVALWLAGGAPDWIGLGLSTALVIALAAPSVRADYLARP